MRNLVLSVTLAALCLVPVQANSDTLTRLSKRAQDALLHVVAHEIEHALIREFDLPLMGPEEAIADDFATVFIHMTLPARAAEIIAARADQNIADNGSAGIFSEYFDDAHRAGRSICLLYGMDPETYKSLSSDYDLEGEAAANCRDSAPEIARGWRRILSNYWMPENARVTEVGLFVDPDIEGVINESGFPDDALNLLNKIDWHSRMTLNLAQCDGTAGFSRNGRRITVCSGYISRFESQLN